MAILELDEAEVNAVKIAQVDITILPNSEWNQSVPHAHVGLVYGREEGGVFTEAYRKSLRFEGAEFGQFMAAFQDLEGRFLQGIMAIKGLRGVVR